MQWIPQCRAWVPSGASPGRRARSTLAVLALMGAAPLHLHGQVVTREEALAAAFPGARIRAERVFLTQEQVKQATALAGAGIPSPLIARYVADRVGKPVGRAYVDTHVVRTKKESLLILLDEDGTVRRIEVTAFLEPPEYRGSADWYGQYRGKTLHDAPALGRSIRPIAGASLTAQAANQAVRRVLAIDRVLEGANGKRDKP